MYHHRHSLAFVILFLHWTLLAKPQPPPYSASATEPLNVAGEKLNAMLAVHTFNSSWVPKGTLTAGWQFYLALTRMVTSHFLLFPQTSIISPLLLTPSWWCPLFPRNSRSNQKRKSHAPTDTSFLSPNALSSLLLLWIKLSNLFPEHFLSDLLQ